MAWFNSIGFRCLLAFLVSFTVITLAVMYGYVTRPMIIRPQQLKESSDPFDPRVINLHQALPTNNPLIQNSNVKSNPLFNLTNGVMKISSDTIGSSGDVIEKSVAIGLGITTRGHADLEFTVLRKEMPFFNQLLPSFCRTSSLGWEYHFYLAHDIDDPFFTTQNISSALFSSYFYSIIASQCQPETHVDLHLVQCDHSGNPAWAQNDAMMAAYMDGIAYYYRVNDDTVMETTEWTEKLVDQLLRFNPPNVGVSGPWFRDGNIAILTHDFVHRTHIDIFGYYYPRVFSDWFADDWITGVYWPERSRKVPGTRITHTMARGSRYVVHFEKANRVALEVEIGKSTIRQWISGVSGEEIVDSGLEANGSHVIAMSLHGGNTDHLYGVLRYGQLVPVMMKRWKLRLYMENPANDTVYPKVPPAIYHKLKTMRVDIRFVDFATAQRLLPTMWHLYSLNDTSVDRILLREANTRPGDREQSALRDWAHSELPCHCIRDHPKHADSAFIVNLLGLVPAQIAKIIGEDVIKKQLDDPNVKWKSVIQFFDTVIWSKIHKHCRCHDSVSCTKWPHSEPFPALRNGNEYVGQSYDLNDIAEVIDTRSWAETYNSPDCVFMKNTGFSVEALRAVLKNRPVLWSQDYHVTPIMDMKSLLNPIGVKLIDKSLSFYCGNIGTCARDLKIITQENGMRLTPELISQFYEVYKNDEDMKSVTAFVCTLPVAMCEAFLPFNKSIVVIATIRYEQGRPEVERWKLLNQRLLRIAADPHSLVAANNLYDAKYIEYFTGIPPFVVPNACNYLHATYSPSRPQFLVTPIHSRELHDYFYTRFDEALMRKNRDFVIMPLRELYPQYLFSDIAAHPGVIYLPYQVSMASFTEQYRMNIPMFFPSLELTVAWHMEYQFVRQRTWDGYREKKSTGSSILGVQTDVPDPNNEVDEKSIRHWIKFADYYQWPHLVYYDSIDDLVDKMAMVNLTALSLRMNEYNLQAKQHIKDQWSKIIIKILT